jgi:hypothetical protein
VFTTCIAVRWVLKAETSHPSCCSESTNSPRASHSLQVPVPYPLLSLTLHTDIALVKNNAKVGAMIAFELSELLKHSAAVDSSAKSAAVDSSAKSAEAKSGVPVVIGS